MANFNKVLLMGNLTRDPELRYSGGGGGGGGGAAPGAQGGGSAICKFGLAVNRDWRDQQGNKHEEVCFVDITVFGRQAETSNEYLRKGRPVFIEGRLQYDTWDDRESGQKRSKLYVVAERVQFLGGRDDRGGGGGGGGGYREGGQAGGERAPREAAPASRGAGGAAGTPAPAGRGNEGVDFDDIPF
ncbi:MAG: Single-stranded DNA-binding protein [Planctomycetes bacterium]|nr:Single-stranded DNA-binding protein [Planctomycetota bacterium]